MTAIPLWTLLGDFLHDLKTQRTRVFLTTFAIVWGTMAIVLMMAFGRGFKTRLISSMLNAGNQVIHIYGGQTGLPFKGLPEGRWISLKTEDAFLLAESIPQIREASPSHGEWGVRLRNGERTATTFMEGVCPEYEVLRTMYPKEKGRFLNEQDMRDKKRVLFLGSVIAKELFGEEEAVEKQVELEGIPFTIVGVMQPKLQMGMNNGPDDRRAIIPFSTFESLYEHRYLQMITIRPNMLTDTDRIRQEVYRVLGRKYRFDPSDKNALHMWDFVTNVKQMQNIFKGIEIFLGVMGGLTLLVAGVGVANIMYVLVKERTREIGIKMAVGARPRHIVMQFIFEALLIATIGGSIGMLVSWSIIRVVALIPVQNQGLAYLGKPVFSLPIFLTASGVLGAISLLAGLFPARKAARLDPVESLRYE